ncbi:MAG TPA: hypothetical protein VGV37_22340 [Aliidongia sp.]|uniref:Tse2 family ADP-ribosyltransferase toxin n=1 Tax=Aliidongia sp. TaxID=1914230 RepID=UPI002DDD3540|nr:hypothetical protein [Aliidongia sp.]HEV2677284.1 hypothetical protein [Aliidongia sp.]
MVNTTVDLFRSVRQEDFSGGVIVDNHAVTGVLYPSLEAKTFESKVRGATVTKTRPADVLPYMHDGKPVVDPGGGTSLFDKNGVFGHKYWFYFTIPKGTIVPDSLTVRHTGHNSTYGAEHYQIEAAGAKLSVEAYKGALDNFARNAVVKLCEAAR